MGKVKTSGKSKEKIIADTISFLGVLTVIVTAVVMFNTSLNANIISKSSLVSMLTPISTIPTTYDYHEDKEVTVIVGNKPVQISRDMIDMEKIFITEVNGHNVLTSDLSGYTSNYTMEDVGNKDTLTLAYKNNIESSNKSRETSHKGFNIIFSTSAILLVKGIYVLVRKI